MPPQELFESTISPNEDSQRTLVRYTMEDVKKELEQITYLESNKSEIIKDMKITKMDLE